ncbi:oligosaccharide repeat unit polymerase [Zoogloea sp.]|uniref:oligosaccharide repeat unit polymerase n=1 Tax=Zoogloea sp. TaxID=49181 RepID=UPI0035B2EFD6
MIVRRSLQKLDVRALMPFALLLALLMVFIAGAAEAISVYVVYYLSLMTLLALVFFQLKNSLALVPLYFLIYIGIGALNISSWRGEISVETIQLYFWGMALLVLPLLLFKNDKQVYSGEKIVLVRKNVVMIIWLHLILAWAATVYVYGTIGFVALDQQLRFRIPTALAYVIRSTLPLVAFLPILKFRRNKLAVFLLAALLPSFLIGFRGVALTGVFAFVFVWAIYNKTAVSRRSIFLAVLVGLFIIYFGFFARRAEGGSLASADLIIAHYFETDEFWVYMLLPLYLALRETIGITSMIIDGGLSNDVNEYPLFVADLYTVFPGGAVAGGQSLGDIIGRVDDGGLTPGILGGVYIDYGVAGLSVFFFLGLLLGYAFYRAKRIPVLLPVYAVILSQFFHLMHRGFLKPEYFTFIAVAFFYSALISFGKSRRHAGR